MSDRFTEYWIRKWNGFFKLTTIDNVWKLQWSCIEFDTRKLIIPGSEDTFETSKKYQRKILFFRSLWILVFIVVVNKRYRKGQSELEKKLRRGLRFNKRRTPFLFVTEDGLCRFYDVFVVDRSSLKDTKREGHLVRSVSLPRNTKIHS